MSGTRIGLVRCDHCARQFNPHSAARHIPWCEKQQSNQRRNNRALSLEKRQALERYKWRVSYRPSNYLAGSRGEPANWSSQSQRQSCMAKSRSSLVSSSVSSPSASSSASAASNQNSAARGGRPAIRRSVSSLTLTRQPGSLPAPAAKGDKRPPAKGGPQRKSWGQEGERAARSKSSADLGALQMGELVESLARRMEEIYEQNKLLLAKLPAEHPPRRHIQPAEGQDSDTSELEEGDGMRGLERLALDCHHCRSGCLVGANYCHNCGCRIGGSAEARRPTEATTTTTTGHSSSPFA